MNFRYCVVEWVGLEKAAGKLAEDITEEQGGLLMYLGMEPGLK